MISIRSHVHESEGHEGYGMKVTAIIPAYNEVQRIAETVAAVRRIRGVDEVLVVDDGSTDATGAVAAAAGARVLTLRRNRGKGGALTEGIKAAGGDVLLFLDADLGRSAEQGRALLEPVLRGEADMTVARFPERRHRGGFGLVKRLAAWGITRLTGRTLRAPLSGQRALRREVIESAGSLAPGWGIEVGLTIDAIRQGYRVLEIPTDMDHAVTGRSAADFWHRGRQFLAVARVLLGRMVPLGRMRRRDPVR